MFVVPCVVGDAFCLLWSVCNDCCCCCCYMVIVFVIVFVVALCCCVCRLFFVGRVSCCLFVCSVFDAVCCGCLMLFDAA